MHPDSESPFSELYIDSIGIAPQKEDADSYVFRLPVIQSLIGRRTLQLHRPVTFFVGENGAGKSTLLEAIAIASGFNPEGGTRNFQFSTAETHSPLWRALTLSRGVKKPSDGFFLRAESFYNVSSEIDRLNAVRGPSLLPSYGGRSLHTRSHGESFLALIENRFGGNGLYILDEPESALSPTGQFTLLVQIGRLVKARSQLLIATHSPILMAYPDAEILCLGDDGLTPTPYRETSHYQLTRSFLENPQRMLRLLLQEDTEG